MSKLELLLLGHFECLLPTGESVTLSTRKAEVLLAYLALAPGIRHPRDRLTNLLWSNRGEEQARNSLRQCLSAIRKALGDSAELVLQIDRSSVTLQAELVEVDALDFERLAEDVEFESWSNAADLYRGEFLEGISIRDAASQEWLDSERTRFKRQHIEILANLGHTQLASHDFNRAIRTAQRLVELDPLSESGWRLLMRSCHENGDRSHALQAFKRCQQVLREELEVEPEADTLALRDAIVAGTGNARPQPAPAADIPQAPAARSSDDHSIAVLPFDNLSGDPEHAFFSDGITTDIIATLSRFRHLKVIARHSTEIYRKRKASIAEIAAEQGVRYILEGSVRSSGKRIRVSAELIDALSEQNIWSERYDRDLDDLFAVQDEITHQIALAMKVQLDDGDKAQHRSAGTTSIKAWELVMLAIDLQDSYIQQNILESRRLIQQALQLDKEYAYAWVMLGWTHWQEAYSGWTISFEQSMQDAAAAVERAFGLDADNGDAWGLASTIQLMNHESDKAMAASRRALELEPGNAEVHALAGMAMNFCGDYDNASEHFDKALRLCPICPNWYYLVGATPELLTNNVDRAIELLRRGVAAEPDSPLVRFYLADALIEKGDEVAARAVAAEIRALDKTMKGHGLVRYFSSNSQIRDRFYRNLDKLDLV